MTNNFVRFHIVHAQKLYCGRLTLISNLNDLLAPPSIRLHALKGDWNGQYSISINDQWRICCRFVDGDAFDVEITDYH
ncbi:MAG: type II toxin-antitoxin system RelE/ParE family toxin [Deltaproteobacteria bacterium]|nr:type II toxin-antitoxin system RelE/ParE family toxin [Deltaproteobacteria bacterium]